MPVLEPIPAQKSRTKWTQVDGEVMFHGGDMCKILGYVHTYKAIDAHCKYLKILIPSDLDGLAISPRGEYFIPESDANRLIMKTKMPDAEEFQDWICKEVILILRVKGCYQIGRPEAQAPAEVAPCTIKSEDSMKDSLLSGARLWLLVGLASLLGHGHAVDTTTIRCRAKACIV